MVATVGRMLREAARGHRRFSVAFVGLVGLLVVANVVRIFGPTGTGLMLGPVVAVVLLVLARRWGLSWDDLGLGRRAWAKGIAYAGGAVAVAAVVYALASVVPLTRAALLDARYHLPAHSVLLTALVAIPFGTVLLEEIAFRGVLLGLVTRYGGIRWGLGLSSVLFGAWHILPALGLARANPAITRAIGDVVGGGARTTLAVVGAAVVITALAGWLLGEVRCRSGSLLAAAGLHWAANGIGVLAAAVFYSGYAG